LLPDWSEEREKNMDYGILHLDAYTVHKTKAVKELARRKGFVLIAPHEGGITGVTQWNDLDCHNVVDARLIALEEDDFHQSLRLRPNRVPTRKRQTVLSDVAAIWTTFAHERMTAASAVRSGLGVALPETLPSGRVSLVGSEDNLVTREAKEFWDAADVPRVRQSALERVHAAVEPGELHAWEQVTDYSAA